MVVCYLFLVSSCDVSPYVCSYYFSVAEWPPFSEIAAHSVDLMFSLYLTICIVLVLRA